MRMATEQVIERHAMLPVHQGNAVTGEAPLWDAPTETLWWIDIQGQRLLGFSPTSGREQVHNLPSMPGLIVARQTGGLVVGLEDGLHAFDPATGLGERLVAVEPDDTRTRLNDGKADPAGRVWFGSMDKTDSGAPIGSLYRLDLNGAVHRHRGDVAVPNAIAFAPDGRTFYFADSRSGTIEAFTYDPETGEADASRLFVRYEKGESPDGTCVDSQGALWIAVIGGSRLERRLPDGTLDTVIRLPVSRPTMPMLGGRDRHTLFVTSQRQYLSREQLRVEPFAGDLLAVRVDVPGPSDPFLASI
jgi:sugar lactone lactonase YvrE